MAPRPVWKGYLKLSLVSCSVELTAATSQSEKVSFRTLNRATGNPVRRQYVDSVTDEPLDTDDEVKGYEVGEDEYVLVEDDEIEALQIESSHTLAVDAFVDKSSIEQIYLDTPYYLTPADAVSREAFAVVRAAMAEAKMAGLARIVLYRRERPVVIEPLGDGMLLTTLRYSETVRRPEDVLDDLGDVEADEEMIDLARHIIEKKKSRFDPSAFEDRYEAALRELVQAKAEGRKPAKPKPQRGGGKVVDLFDALKRSLAEDGGGKAAAKSGGKGSSSGKAAARSGAKSADEAGAKPAEKPAAKSSAGRRSASGGRAAARKRA